MLTLQAEEPEPLVAPAQLRLGPLGQRQVGGSVRPAGRLQLALGGQPLLGIRPHRLQHAKRRFRLLLVVHRVVARAIGPHPSSLLPGRVSRRRGQDEALLGEREQSLQRPPGIVSTVSVCLQDLAPPTGLAGNDAGDSAGDSSSSVEGDAAHEDAQAAEEAPLLLAQEVITPPHRRFQTLLTSGQVGSLPA